MSSTLLGCASAAISARLVATVVVPTPPLGLNTATRRCRPSSPMAPPGPGPTAGGLRPQREGLDAGDELGLVERLGDDVVGAGLEEGDALVEVGRSGRRRGPGAGRLLAGPEHRDDVADGGRGGHGVDHHQAVAGGRGDGLVGAGDDGHAVTRRGQRGRQRLDRLRSAARSRIESCTLLPGVELRHQGNGDGERIRQTAVPRRASPAVAGQPDPQPGSRVARAILRGSFRLRAGMPSAGQIPLEGVEQAVRRYELMLVLKPDAPDERAAAVIDRTTRYVVASGGQIVKVAPWGRRRLAYPIDRYREGSYHIVVFEAPAEAIAEMERSLQITEDVLRYLVTRAIKPVKARRDAAASGDGRRTRTSTSRPPRTRRWTTRSSSRSTSPRARPRPRPSTEREEPAMAFAKVMIIGNLGRDPEMRYTPNGRPVTEFSVAVSHSKPDGSGGWVDEGTDWFRVTVWGDRAERTAEQFRKGNKVFVEGRFRTREYEAKDGQKRTSLEITADNVISLDARVRDEEGGSFAAPSGGFAGGPVAPAAAAASSSPLARPHRRVTTTSTTSPSDDPSAAERPPRRVTRHHPGDTATCPPARRSATTTTAIAGAGRSAPSAPTRRSRSTTRRSTASAATCPSAPRSSRAARPAPAPRTSASSRSRSSGPATWRCSRTRRSTSAPDAVTRLGARTGGAARAGRTPPGDRRARPARRRRRGGRLRVAPGARRRHPHRAAADPRVRAAAARGGRGLARVRDRDLERLGRRVPAAARRQPAARA